MFYHSANTGYTNHEILKPDFIYVLYKKRHFHNRGERVQPYYYRTHNQAAVDLILDTNQGLIPIEIKVGSVTAKKQILALERFVQEHHCRYGLVVNNGDEVFKISPSVYQLPAIYL